METKKGVKVPESLAKTLQESKELKNAWDKLRPSCQREYVERVNKAKSEENGYYSSNGASHFGQMMPVIAVQMMPF